MSKYEDGDQGIIWQKQHISERLWCQYIPIEMSAISGPTADNCLLKASCIYWSALSSLYYTLHLLYIISVSWPKHKIWVLTMIIYTGDFIWVHIFHLSQVIPTRWPWTGLTHKSAYSMLLGLPVYHSLSLASDFLASDDPNSGF